MSEHYVHFDSEVIKCRAHRFEQALVGQELAYRPILVPPVIL